MSKSTKRQRAQQALAHALYHSYGFRANLSFTRINDLCPEHRDVIRRHLQEVDRQIISLQLAIHDLARKEYLR